MTNHILPLLLTNAIFFAIFVSYANAQDYPSTQYKSFGGSELGQSDFAVTPPRQPDAPAWRTDSNYRSMSPSNWGQSDLGVANGAIESSTFNSPVPRSVLSSNSGGEFEFGSSQNSIRSLNNLSTAVDPVSPIVRTTVIDSNHQFKSASFARNRASNRIDGDNDISAAPNVPESIRYEPTQAPNWTANSSRYPMPGDNADPDVNSDFESIPGQSGAASSTNPNASNVNPPRIETYDSIIRNPRTSGNSRGENDKRSFNNPSVEQPRATPYANWDQYGETGAATVQQREMFVQPSQNYRPDLGHRNDVQTIRNWGTPDDGEKFGFDEKEKEYPPMSEILATGRYFASGSMMYLKPHFQGNTAISTSGSGISTPFDFDYEVAPQFNVGFESKYGPGVQLSYFQYDESSNVATFTGSGGDQGITSAWMGGPNQWSRLTAGDGETLNAVHDFDMESMGANFFKELKFKISRLNGKFGFQYVSIAHQLEATVTDSGGAEIGSLRSRSDMRAIGPTFELEYFRPIGHTKFELLTSFGGSVLFGQQDQFIENSVSGDLSRVGADEFLTVIDFMSGVQYQHLVAENRYLIARAGLTFQTWIGGGTAVLPQDDFGLRGFSFTVGYNR